MRRVPIFATLIVAAAVATMLALGVWQLRRAAWKEALLADYARATTLPPIAFPAVPTPDERYLFRRATGFCLEPLTWSARAGRSRAGEPGWRHVVRCRTGAEGPGMSVDAGWSKEATAPRGWRGGEVTGMIDADRDALLLLVADRSAPGLQPSARPSPADIPNNHRAYAVQWVVFALTAVVVYVLALRRRVVAAPPPRR